MAGKSVLLAFARLILQVGKKVSEGLAGPGS